MVKTNTATLQFRDYGLWLALAGFFALLVYALATVLLPFIAAGLVAYMVEPMIHKLARLKIPRAVSAVLVIVVFLMMVLGLMSLLVPLLMQEIMPLFGRAPEIFHRLTLYLAEKFPSVNWANYLQMDAMKNLLIDQQDLIKRVLQSFQAGLLKGGGNALTVLANVLLFPVALFYFILAWPTFSSNIKTLMPPKALNKTLTVLNEIDRVLAEYLHGQVLVMLALAAYYALGLTLTDLPHGFSLGILTGLLVLIPYLGFVFGLLLAIFVVVLSGDSSMLWWVGLVFLLGQILESYLLTPFLVGERIGLHPLAVIFALLAFGQLLGFVGVLLALPASAILLVLLRHLRDFYRESKFYQLS